MRNFENYGVSKCVEIQLEEFFNYFYTPVFSRDIFGEVILRQYKNQTNISGQYKCIKKGPIDQKL